MSRFQSVRWGSHRILQIPSYLVKDETLCLPPKAIAVFLALLQASRKHGLFVPVTSKVSQLKLMERTGFSKNVITDAVKQLEDNKFIECSRKQRMKYQEFSVNSYSIWNPGTDQPIFADKDQTIFYSNRITYFTMPRA